jgi:hypothetical protein
MTLVTGLLWIEGFPQAPCMYIFMTINTFNTDLAKIPFLVFLMTGKAGRRQVGPQ